MTWQLSAFLLLGLALAAGFAWYERGRPDAKVVALVGTLAAFAALGRVAFAALPNVKPTTDIVLVAGYALGGAPGFVVGAVAALTSNFFFGQGPWTPWQMVGWGMTGLLGAGIATVTRSRIGRIPLAAVCFVAGFGFTALQDAGDWVTYSDHSLAQLGIYVGKGIAFDLVHAAGCAAFALAFGPALMHSLQRFRHRLNISWSTAAFVAVAVLGAASTVGSLAAPRAAFAASGTPATPVSYLLAAQNADGGFGPAPHLPSSPLDSGWGALGLAAAGESLANVSRDGHSLLSYLRNTPQGSDSGSVERTILALSAAGVRSNALLAELDHRIRSDGSVSEQTNLTAFAVLALRAAGVQPSSRTIVWLARQQDGDGGFNFATGGHQTTSDVDDSGAVLEALAGTRQRSVINRAIRFLDRAQNPDGGFPSNPGGPSNAQSTAFAAQGLIAVGAPRPGSAIAYLRSLKNADGSIDYARRDSQTPVWVTAQAEMALAGRPLPLQPDQDHT